MPRAPAAWWFGGIWDIATQRSSTVPTRQMRAAVAAIDFKPGVGRKPNIRMLFALARWAVKRESLPKKSLAKFIDDFELFEILRLNGEIDIAGAFFLGDLTLSELQRLEKRLHHQWPLVQKITDALRLPQTQLDAYNLERRKYQWRPPKGVKSIVSTVLGV